MKLSGSAGLAVVLYLNQMTDREGHDRMVRVTREVIDLSTRHRGRFTNPFAEGDGTGR